MANIKKQLIVSRKLAPLALRHYHLLTSIVKTNIVIGYKNISEVEEIIIDYSLKDNEYKFIGISKKEQERLSSFFSL